MPLKRDELQGLAQQLAKAAGRVATRALTAVLRRLFEKTQGAQPPPVSPEPEQRPAFEEPLHPEPDPQQDLPAQQDGAAESEETETNTLLHRFAAGEGLSPAGAALCRRLREEFSGYEPNSVLEAAIVEGRFDSEDLVKIAGFLVSLSRQPGADTYSNQALARTVFQELSERNSAPSGLIRVCVDTMSEGCCEWLTYPMEGYLRKAAKLDPESAALVIQAFNPENYAAYCRRQPGCEAEPPQPADWNEWEGHQAWSDVGRTWPLAEVFAEVASVAVIDRLLAEEPRDGIPSHHTLQYFLLRRSWREKRECPGSLPALGKLLRNTASKPAWKHLHDRAVLVFRDHWTRSQLGSLTNKAAEAYLGLLRLQPAIGLQHPPEPLAGMNRLHLARLQEPQQRAPAAAREPRIPPSQEALFRRFERLRAAVDERPEDSLSWHELAGIYRELSEWDKAIIAEDLAIEHHPNYVLAHYWRGKTWVEIQGWTRAESDLTAAIRIWEFRGGLEKYLTLEQPPDAYVDSYRTRGVAKAHQGDYDGAIADLEIAVRLNRNNGRLHFELAYLEEKAGRVREAAVDAYNAAVLYLDGGDRSGAEECVEMLSRLGAEEEADTLRVRMAGRKPSDLPI